MSDLLLDSHAMLWFFWDDPHLSQTAKALIEDPNNRKLVSIPPEVELSGWRMQAESTTGRRPDMLPGSEPSRRLDRPLECGDLSPLFLCARALAFNPRPLSLDP
jgi:hypothetical protein